MTTKRHTPRVEFKDGNPRVYPLMREFSQYVESSSISPGLRELIKIRASQLNQCAFCLDMHIQVALQKGESADRLHLLCVWREAPHFSAPEKVALEFTEAVTRIGEHGVPEDLYNRVREHFTAEQYIDLLVTINLINAWNRFMVAMGHTPEQRDQAPQGS